MGALGILIVFWLGGFLLAKASFSTSHGYLRAIHAQSLSKLPSCPDWLMLPNRAIRSLLRILPFLRLSLDSRLWMIVRWVCGRQIDGGAASPRGCWE